MFGIVFWWSPLPAPVFWRHAALFGLVRPDAAKNDGGGGEDDEHRSWAIWVKKWEKYGDQ